MNVTSSRKAHFFAQDSDYLAVNIVENAWNGFATETLITTASLNMGKQARQFGKDGGATWTEERMFIHPIIAFEHVVAIFADDELLPCVTPCHGPVEVIIAGTTRTSSRLQVRDHGEGFRELSATGPTSDCICSCKLSIGCGDCCLDSRWKVNSRNRWQWGWRFSSRSHDRSIFPALIVVAESQLLQRPLFVEVNPRDCLVSIGDVDERRILLKILQPFILARAFTKSLWKTRKRWKQRCRHGKRNIE